MVQLFCAFLPLRNRVNSNRPGHSHFEVIALGPSGATGACSIFHLLALQLLEEGYHIIELSWKKAISPLGLNPCSMMEPSQSPLAQANQPFFIGVVFQNNAIVDPVYKAFKEERDSSNERLVPFCFLLEEQPV